MVENSFSAGMKLVFYLLSSICYRKAISHILSTISLYAVLEEPHDTALPHRDIRPIENQEPLDPAASKATAWPYSKCTIRDVLRKRKRQGCSTTSEGLSLSGVPYVLNEYAWVYNYG